MIEVVTAHIIFDGFNRSLFRNEGNWAKPIHGIPGVLDRLTWCMGSFGMPCDGWEWFDVIHERERPRPVRSVTIFFEVPEHAAMLKLRWPTTITNKEIS